MPQQRLYYEYENGDLIPYWYALTFDLCEIDWDKPAYYFEVIKPFEYIERIEFDESLISMSIQLADFIFNVNYPNRIGINLKSIKKRIEKHGVDPYIVQQFILSTPELNDFLMFLPQERKQDFITIC
ncbi:hypothetical protein J2Z23_004207 [Lederbergia galactosidilyticus]|uniref:hypothetical protein n=1 Tax=Lederbergia galactosidilytica TaxID=217031 RepID=UPI001AE3279C|nr:hypothetical protein [Lederbergia galactosidilytica]MBP1917222.1 hypothetical protein [Lederbergia galactosidilytica]